MIAFLSSLKNKDKWLIKAAMGLDQVNKMKGKSKWHLMGRQQIFKMIKKYIIH